MWPNRLCHVSQLCVDVVNACCSVVNLYGLTNCNQYRLFVARTPSITGEFFEAYSVSDPFPA